MIMLCSFHKKEHDDYEWRSNSYGTFCREAISVFEQPVETTFNIGGGSKDQRIKHWQDIRSRVTTHEGQFLSGKAGQEYQKKYSKQFLGRDLSQPTDFNQPQYQKELAKTK